ncbi:MAG: tetratricopeptide repeat protein [Planctomycetes bacterium]|nr:tetratricopeptide repeat protein [Planctomycetota bacterium]
MVRIDIGSLLLVFALAALPVAPARAQEKKADVTALQQKAQAALQAQKWDDAATALKSLAELTPDDASVWLSLGVALHNTGKYDEALAADMKAAEFAKAKANASYNAACTCASKKDKDKAFEWLNKAIAAGFSNRKQVIEDEDLASLRDDPRFQSVLDAMAAKQKGPKPGANSVGRGSSVASRGTADGGKAQASIEYGKPVWKTEYASMVDSGKLAGQRWRLGQDDWTTLETKGDVTLGDVPLKPGTYDLTLEKKEGNKVVLSLHDPEVLRAKKITPAAVSQYAEPALYDIPIAIERSTEIADALTIKLAMDPSDDSKGSLTIRFGPFKGTVPLRLAPAK